MTDTRNAVDAAIPTISFNGQDIEKTAFGNYSVLPGMQPVSHLSLAYALYLREGTKMTGALLADRHAAAQSFVGQEIELDVDTPEIVFTGEGASNLAAISAPGVTTSKAPALGAGRDTVFNLVPNKAGQETLSAITFAVCGMKSLTTATGAPVHYHLTAAQANLNPMFKALLAQTSSNESAVVRPSVSSEVVAPVPSLSVVNDSSVTSRAVL